MHADAQIAQFARRLQAGTAEIFAVGQQHDGCGRRLVGLTEFFGPAQCRGQIGAANRDQRRVDFVEQLPEGRQVVRQRHPQPGLARKHDERNAIAAGQLRQHRLDIVARAREAIGVNVAREHRARRVEAEDQVEAAALDRHAFVA